MTSPFPDGRHPRTCAQTSNSFGSSHPFSDLDRALVSQLDNPLQEIYIAFKPCGLSEKDQCYLPCNSPQTEAGGEWRLNQTLCCPEQALVYTESKPLRNTRVEYIW